MMKPIAAIGIDAGGTKIATGLIDANAQIVAKLSAPTPVDDAVKAMDALAHNAEKLVRRFPEYDVVGVGAGLPGLVDPDAGIFAYGPHFPMRDVAVALELSKRLRIPVQIDNDATLATWAERLYGAGDRCDSMVLLTIGTGIGGGIVDDGRIVHGANGYSGEFGHMSVDHTSGMKCTCGHTGCWETVGSGNALDRAALRLYSLDPDRYRPYLVNDIADGRMFGAALADHDHAAEDEFHTFTNWVAIGIQNLIQVLDAARVVIGGGVSAMGETLLEPVRTNLRARLSGGDYRPRIDVRIAELGPDAGMVGAAALFMEPST